MLDAPRFQRCLGRAQEGLAQMAVVVRAGGGLHARSLARAGKVSQHVVIDNNAVGDYIDFY